MRLRRGQKTQAVTTPQTGTATPAITRPATPWAVKAALIVLSPLVFFALLEVILGLAGYGYPTHFFLQRNRDGKQVLVQNDQFGWRFFGPELSRTPRRQVFPRQKPANTCRIFVLGESAAFGDPQPDYGLPRMLEVLLRDRHPELHFEVVNAAMTAINSHVLLPIARDCARADGDLWVIYMGNNEVVGPFGGGTVFGPKAPALPVIRGSLALKTTRTGQLLDALLQGPAARNRKLPEWGGLSMFLDQQVRADDPAMTRVYSHFERNLHDMLAAGIGAHARIIVCNMVCNLVDCGPFASQHSPNLSDAQRRIWEDSWGAACQAQTNGNKDEALRNFQMAAAIDDHFAELQYRWAKALGKDPEAICHYLFARDYDTLRFRADSRINSIIREKASGREADGVYFLDAEKALDLRSPRLLPGSDLFYEHVHFNFEGNYWLARSIAERAEEVLPQLHGRPGQAPRPWLKVADCAERLAWTDWDRYLTLQSVQGRLNDPPFTHQSTHDAEVAKLRAQIETLLPAIEPTGLRHADAIYAKAITQSPTDWVLYQARAHLLRKMGDYEAAISSLEKANAVIGPAADFYMQMGLLLNEQGRSAEAINKFESALSLDPGHVDALNGIGVALAHEKRYSEAAVYYEKALKLRPNSIDGHLNLAVALEALGEKEQAEEHFRLGMQRKPLTPDSLVSLGNFLMQQNRQPEALSNFLAAVRLDPTYANARFCAGLALVAVGNRGEAEAQFREAVRLNPNLAEARVGLGIELGRAGKDLEALEQFAEAVKLKPQFVEAHLNLGIALIRQHRREEALHEFTEAVRLAPNNERARQLLQQNQ